MDFEIGGFAVDGSVSGGAEERRESAKRGFGLDSLGREEQNLQCPSYNRALRERRIYFCHGGRRAAID